MLEVAANHIPELTALGSVFLTALVTRLFRMKAKLHYSVSHASTLLINEPVFDEAGKKLADIQAMHTADIIVQNDGLLPAKSVEVTFNWKPRVYNVVPARAFTTETIEMNRFAIRFDSMAPAEQVTIHIMSINQDLPALTVVRAENSVGTQIPLAPMRVWPKWFNAACLGLLAIGLTTVFYWIASGIIQLAALSPAVEADRMLREPSTKADNPPALIKRGP